MKSVSILVAVALALLFAFARAEEGEKAGPPAWMRRAKEHDMLARYVGNWTFSTRHFAVPGQEPITSSGTSAGALVLNGNYLRFEIRGAGGGAEWVGVWHLGYDTIDEQFVGVWMDDHSPVPGISRGVEQEGVLTLEGDGVNPATGTKRRSRSRFRWEGADRLLLVTEEIAADGTARTLAEIEYRRKS
ncbi:MAG: DUF1579 family protein [Planctomycetaceae bacterium]